MLAELMELPCRVSAEVFSVAGVSVIIDPN